MKNKAPLIFLSFLFFSCASTSKLINERKIDPLVKNYQIAEGIFQTDFYSKSKKISYTLVQIDLQNSDLDFLLKENSTFLQKTESVKNFANKTSSLIAINTTPFKVKNRFSPCSKAISQGINIFQGKTMTPPVSKYACLSLFKSENAWKCRIFNSQDDLKTLPALPEICTGGFWTVLENGNVIPFKQIKDIRSACASKNDGKTLILFAGKNLTYMQTAEILKSYGAQTAMNFDGGSSTQLVIKGKNKVKKNVTRLVPSILAVKHRNITDLKYIDE